MKLILNVLIPTVSTVGLISIDLQTFKKKSPTGKQACLLFISLSSCKNITTPIFAIFWSKNPSFNSKNPGPLAVPRNVFWNGQLASENVHGSFTSKFLAVTIWRPYHFEEIHLCTFTCHCSWEETHIPSYVLKKKAYNFNKNQSGNPLVFFPVKLLFFGGGQMFHDRS